MIAPSDLVHPVILSGGSGTRLWPLSRALYPKQLLALHAERSMLQETVLRVADNARFGPPLLICNAEHRFIVAEQLQSIASSPRAIVLEPEGRNTAPAAAVAALMLADENPDALVMILPSDHIIADAAGFQAVVAQALPAAQSGALVTFGMAPTKAETGYGYILQGDAVGKTEGCFAVERFVEKPDPKTAGAMLDEGGWYWNSGIFLFQAQTFLDELERHRPGVVDACRAAIEGGREDLDFFRLEPAAFATLASESIDYAVMENTDAAAVVPAHIGWNDIGSWAALWDVSGKDADGNVVLGDAIAEDTQDCYIRTDGPLIATLGLRDILVVATSGATLVTTKDKAQHVRKLVEHLKQSGSDLHVSHARVYQPWGSYQSIDLGDHFQVKQLEVKPGAKLSLQSHRHRAEHWVVVEGTARVTRGAETFDLDVNQSTYIPSGTKHRLENPGRTRLRVIEVQTGDYLGEDDITRYDDVYGR